MNAHIFQHVPFEGAGFILDWLDSHNACVTYSRFYEKTSLPKTDEVDLLVIMGGPMSVNDEAAYPWLREEKEFTREAIRSGVSVLGICLGAQMIASSLGAKVYRNPVKEIGWFPVRSTPEARRSFGFPRSFMAFHWHGETFDLPDGAVRLAGTEECRNQAFMIGRNVVGLQFHVEATPQSVKSMASNCSDELTDGPFIQSVSQILGQDRQAYSGINGLMDKVISFLVVSGIYGKSR